MSENPLLISLIGGLEIGRTGDALREPELAGIPLGLLAVLAYESCDGAIVTGDEIGRICWGDARWVAKDIDARRGDFKSALSKVRKAIDDDGRNPEYLVGDFHGLRLEKRRVLTDWRDLRGRENGKMILSEARNADFRFLANIGLRSVSAKWLEDARESANDAFDDLLDAEAALALDDDDLDVAIESWTQRRMIARRRGFTEYAAEIDAWIAQTKKARATSTHKLPTGEQQKAARKLVPERTEWPLSVSATGMIHDVQTVGRIDALDLIASEISVTDRLLIAGSVPPNIVGFLINNAGYLPEKVTLCLDGSRRSSATLARLADPGNSNVSLAAEILGFDERVRLEIEITSAAAYVARVDGANNAEEPSVLRFGRASRQFGLFDQLASKWLSAATPATARRETP